MAQADRRSQPYVFPSMDAVRAYGQLVRAGGGIQGVPQSIAGSFLGAPTQYAKPKLIMRNNGEILIQGADSGYMPPLQALQPIAQGPYGQVQGRAWDYPIGYNTRVTPRGENAVTFSQLYALSHYDIISLIISRVQDKICTKPWAILPKDKKAKKDSRCQEVEDFLQSPDKMHTWSDWARMLVHQMIVYDAPALYLRPTMGGDLYSIEVLDGSMFTPKIMGDGRVPPFDVGPGYQQVLKRGMPAVDYIRPVPKGVPVPTDTDGFPMPELLYKPRNPRVNTPYGYGPLEQMIVTIEIGLGRQQFLKEYYNSGSTPDLLISCPPEWTTEQIIQFQVNWDAMLAGNLAQRRGTKFVPDALKVFDTKDKALTDATDDYLVRIFCFALGISPMPFIKMMNRASGEQHNVEASEEGQVPWQHYFVDLFNVLIPLKWGYKDIGFRWEEESETDPAAQTTIDIGLVNAKIYHPDEIRAQRGDEAMPDDMRAEMDLANFNGAANSTVLPDDQQAAENEHALAMQAAKPTPVVAGKSDAQKFAEFLELVKRDPAPPINVTVEAPVINGAPVHVHPAQVNVTTPDIKLGDTFVDVGGANVQAKFDMPKGGAPVTKVISDARKNADGTYSAKITESVAREVGMAKADE